MAADQSEWTELEPGWSPAELHSLGTIELLDEFSHPVRGALLRHLKQPRTVAELAAVLDVPVTRLYHHVGRLERDGLVRVVATRRVGVVTERRYQVVARRFDVARDLLEHGDRAALGRAVAGLFDVARSAMLREFELGTFSRGDIEELATQSLLELALTPARRRELLARLSALIEEFGGDEDGEPYRLFVAAFPETP